MEPNGTQPVINQPSQAVPQPPVQPVAGAAAPVNVPTTTPAPTVSQIPPIPANPQQTPPQVANIPVSSTAQKPTEDSNGAVIVRPEDVYGKIIPNIETPVAPVTATTQQQNVVPNFPSVEQAQTGNQQTSNGFFTSSPATTYSSPNNSTETEFGGKSLVGLSGSSLEKKSGREIGFGVLKAFLMIGVVILFILLVVAADFYFEYVKDIPFIEKVIGFNLFEKILGQ